MDLVLAIFTLFLLQALQLFFALLASVAHDPSNLPDPDQNHSLPERNAGECRAIEQHVLAAIL